MATNYENQVNQAYRASDTAQQTASLAFDRWQSAMSTTMQAGYQAYDAAKQTGQQLMAVAEMQSNQMLIAGANAGITADSVYRASQAQLQQDQTLAGMRVGSQKVAFAGGGLQMAGSASMLVRETLDQSLAQQKSDFLNYATQEANLRQQQQNLNQQSAQTLQNGRAQYNAMLKQGADVWLNSGIRAAGA